MWVYRKTDDRYCVGYYTPAGEWVDDSAYATQGEAALRVHWLNGGS